MTLFNVYMHNKVMLYVQNISGHKSALESDGVNHLKRLSYLNDGTEIAHLSVPVGGRIYEIVGPSSYIDTTGFVAWSAELNECPEAHRLTFYDTISDYAADYSYQVANVQQTTATWNGMQTPMIVQISSVSDAPKDQNDLRNLREFTGSSDVTATYDGQGADGTDKCEVMDITWDSSLDYMVPTRYVMNEAASHGSRNVKEYLSYIDECHQDYSADYEVMWGDNWDRWMDQHVGILTTTLPEKNKQIKDKLVDQGTPVSYRWGGGITGEDDDIANYHYYVGYRSVFAWEFYVMGLTNHEDEVRPVELCACIATNNDDDYEESTGATSCPS
jgi:hypothetical protein